MADQSILDGIMANPYVLLVSFLLTLIGASSGLFRIFKFLRSYGSGLFHWSFRKVIEHAVSSAVEHITQGSSEFDGVMSFYMSRLSGMILTFAGFVFNIAAAVYITAFGLSPLFESESWKFLVIPFLILILINITDLWIARFEIFIFRQALPEIKVKLAEKA